MPSPLWESGPGLITAAGFLCLPVLQDPDVARDLEAAPGDRPCRPGGPPAVLKAAGRFFTPVLKLDSLLENYAALWPASYEELRRSLLEELGLPREDGLRLDDKLGLIVFEVLPHFVRLTPTSAPKRWRQDDLLDRLARRLEVPRQYREQAEAGAAPESLARRAAALKAAARPLPPPPQGLISPRGLDDWLRQALRAKILAQEQAALCRQGFASPRDREAHLTRTALLLYLTQRGHLELEGFGFFRRNRPPGDYVVYRRTGEFALKDYYGRLYLFPDCRVAVSTGERLRPVVLEKYKHPFLRRHGPNQEICLPKGYQPPLAVTAAHLIQALEAGLNALFYGYNPRRRNGYHSLDRMRLDQDISFDDYRLSPDDPRVVSGQVEVKNYFA